MEPQRAEPLYQQVYRILRTQILQGHYKPGDVLLESHIAQRLKVSRTPVREALRRLSSERLAVANGSELCVANPTPNEVEELYLCRAALENIVAERAAESCTQSDLELMGKALDEAKAAILTEDHAQVFAANTRFHDHMVSSTRMPMLSGLIESIRAPILVARRHVLAGSVDIENTIWFEHTVLLAAIRDHNPVLAKQRMQEHMANDLQRAHDNFLAKRPQH